MMNIWRCKNMHNMQNCLTPVGSRPYRPIQWRTEMPFLTKYLRRMAMLPVALALSMPLGQAAEPGISDDVVKIGIMNDQSGPYADLAGPGSDRKSVV